MTTKIMNMFNKLIRRGSGANLNLFRYATMVLVLLTLGIGNAWAGHGGKCTAQLQVNKGTGSGSVYAATTGSATSGSPSASADCGDSDSGTHTHIFYAFATPADGYTFLGWTESATSTAGADASNPKAVTITSESHSTVTKTLYAHFVEKAKVNITFEAPSNGTYTIAVNGGSAETVSSANVVKNNVTGVTLTATPASGYAFAGWYKLNSAGEFVEDLSIASPYDASFTTSETIKMGARFVPTTLGKFILKGSSTEYYGLKAATVAAGGSGTIVPVADETLVDGSDLMPFDNGTYSIKAGATLLVPYSSANTVQTAPVKINTTPSATAISSYRKLILSDGVNIDCDGTICVGGQADAGGGGNPSGYVTGACGVIDMSKGGHIEMNNKAILYCWGFIKGQDMDQGNNTVGAGTITANPGSVIWEDFSVGDWRGGTATSNFGGRFFPFQSYYIQNIEVPVTYKYGSTLKNFFTFNMSSSAQETTFDVIGSNTALFKLTDAQSLVRKWYDPTTDLVCYEVSGTAVLDYISLEVYITINSYDYDLPISSNMHIILTKCNLTLNRPMLVQPGGIIEIKNDANVTLATKIYMYDKDEWGPWISGKYYRSYGDAYPILTSHKNRGNGSSNADLDDATFLVDGTLTISSGAGLYSSTGGANIMGNGGGKVVFSSSLPSATSVKWYKGTKTSGDGEVGTTAMKAANLCNEDGSYTQSIASTTFHNVNGRWFAAAAKDEKANHTYDFMYISSGEVSGTGGTSSTTDAVYSNDKTGMEARMKWANVTADACADWWYGQGDQAGWFYNWTMNSAWHQFQSTETEGLYSGSNNTLYTKSDCTWEELGSTDINCLYTIDGKKKALVDGHFIELEPNSDDAAFHEVADATKYYICFEGCNWHAATKYEGEKKAYVVDETTFIWFEERWMAVEREEPFFYTKDETNVTIYYEYIGSEWVLAQPYVEVTDAIETRQLLRFNEAITVASAKKNVTIKLLRDLVNITTPMTFTGANTTCTLDLNGHVAELQVTGSGTTAIYMLTLNGAGTTFTITDNTAEKKGELRLIASVSTATNTQRWSGIYVQNGSLVMQSGKVYIENPFAWVSNSNTGFISGILVASAKTFTMNGGTLHVEADYNPYGINAASGTPTVNINHGTIECIATKKDSPYGIIGYGTINIKNDSYIHANAKANTSARGVSVSAGSSYQGTVNVTGGTIYAEATGSAQGIYCGGTAVVTGDYNATTPNNTPKNRYYAKANISGGTITAVCRTSTSSYGVLSYGTTTISGGTITSTVQKSNQNTAYGVCANGGTTTIKTGANITANAPANAYGLCSSAANGSSAQGWAHVGDLKVEGGTITANTTNGTTAYGLLVTGTTYTISRTDGYKVFNGDYAAAGTATVTGGTFYANAKTTLARGIVVAATKTKNEASATPKCTINGGYYKMTGTGDLLGCNASALAADFHINGGYYSHNGNLATYAASPKHVLTLASGDANRPPYYYKVAEAYQVTFKTEDGTANIIDPIYQEVNTKPVCSTEPTKASTSTNSFTFDGWATAANGDKVYEPNGLPNVTSAGATYYAHFATTTLKYRVHLDATTNGGECATENIYVEPGTAVGTLPTATKYGYTFSGWFTAASGGTKLEATTVINANADYYAQFTVNSHTLTWDLAGGAVGTAGKIGSTTWPAKNATGTQSRSVAYGTVLTTIPVVTKAGYVFNRWDPVPTSSMPDNDVTYTALWNPATNTKYYVKHYQQNIDDDNYTLVETGELTGTTDATVTPDRKSYDGFLTPTPQQLTIGAAGTSELVYNYDRVVYTINWNASANGGTCATTSTDVRHGANIALPAATKAGHILEGWYTKAEGGNKISDGAAVLQNYGTLYAQFIEVPTYKLTWDWNGGETSSTSYTAAVNLLAGDPIVYPEDNTMTRENYVFNGWSTNASTMPNENFTITAQWVSAVASVAASGTPTTYHATVADAISAANGKTNAVVTMLQNASVTSKITISAAMTIDLNGKTITSTIATKETGTFYINASGKTVTIRDNGTGGKIYQEVSCSGYLYGIHLTKGSLAIESGTIHIKNTANNRAYAIYTDGSALSIIVSGSAVVKAESSNSPFGLYSSASNSLTMNGGTFIANGAGSRGIYMKGTTNLTNATITVTGSTKAYAIFAVSGTMNIYSGTYTTSGASDNLCIYHRKNAITIHGGYFSSSNKLYAKDTGDASYTGTITLQGGYYNNNTELAAKCATNYHVLPNADASYPYKVAEAYTVTFDANGHGTAPESQVIEKGQKATEPTAPTATGYTFGGWYKEAGCTNAWNFTSDVVTAATPLYAKWTVNKYTITWVDGNGATMKTEQVAYGETPAYSGATPTKTATAQYTYTFNNTWSPAIVAVTGAATYTAQFNSAVNKYTITWVDGNGATLKTEQVEYGQTPAYSGATPTKDQTAHNTYTFNDTWSPAITSVTGDATYTAQFNETVRKYRVTWDAATNGGTCATEYTDVSHNSAIGTLPVATKTGHDFLGWYTTYTGGGNQVTAATVINFATTAYARFAPSTYTVQYKDQGDTDFSGVHGDGYPTTHTYGTATALINPTKYGYTFEGWYDNAACTGTALTEIGATVYTADFTLYAKWAIKTNCTITWLNYDGTTQLHQSTTSWGSTPSYPAHLGTPTRPGDEHRTYTFKGWSPEIHLADGDETYIAQYDMSITTCENGSYTVSGAEDAVATTVQVSGSLHVPEYNSLTTTDLILEASDNSSGMIEGIERLQVNGNAYFDYEFDTDPWHWSAFGVPFEIDLDAAALLKEKTTPLVLGSDYDIVYYDSEERALHGPSTNCWKYVEYNSHTLVPGRLYMIAFNRPLGHVNVIRFTKASGAAVDFTSNVPLYNDGSGINDNWNGVANPKLFHALLNAGVTECQVHDGGEIKKDGYDMYDMNNKKFFVGKAVFVQVPYNQSPMYADPATTQGPIVVKAPRRTRAEESAERYDVKIAPMAEEMEDHIYLLTSEDKADEYVIVADLVKAGVSPVRAQMWVDRYGVQLCKNTTEWINNVADYPLGISVPADGDYDIWLEDRPDNDDLMYLTLDGERIWNLSYGACTIELKKGTTQRYGIRVVSNAPSVTTGMDEAGVLNEDSVRKVLIDEKVYIIRNGELYSITGQKAK